MEQRESTPHMLRLHNEAVEHSGRDTRKRRHINYTHKRCSKSITPNEVTWPPSIIHIECLNLASDSRWLWGLSGTPALHHRRRMNNNEGEWKRRSRRWSKEEHNRCRKREGIEKVSGEKINGGVCKRETDTDKKIKGRSGGDRTVVWHLWVSLLIWYLQEVDGVSQGGLLQCQGEDQGELLS